MVKIPGFAKIPNSIMQRARAGRLTPSDLGLYTFLHLNCNWSTGIYHGTALGIAMQFDDARLQSLVQKSLHRLRALGVVNYRQGSGQRGGYDILIDNYEPTLGARSGYRLNAWKHGEKAIPEYESGAVEAVEGMAEEVRSSGGPVTEKVQRSGGGVAEAARNLNELDGPEDPNEPDNSSQSVRDIDPAELERGEKTKATTTSTDTPKSSAAANIRPPEERLTQVLLFRFYEYSKEEVTEKFYERTVEEAHKPLAICDLETCKKALRYAKTKPFWVGEFKNADTPMRYLAGVLPTLIKQMESAPPPSKAQAIAPKQTSQPTERERDTTTNPFDQWKPKEGKEN